MNCDDTLVDGPERETVRLERLALVFRQWHEEGKREVRARNQATGKRVIVAPSDYLAFDIARGELIGNRWAVLFIDVEVREVEPTAPDPPREVPSRLRRRLLREAWAANPNMEAEEIRTKARAEHPEAAELLDELTRRHVQRIVAAFKASRKG